MGLPDRLGSDLSRFGNFLWILEIFGNLIKYYTSIWRNGDKNVSKEIIKNISKEILVFAKLICLEYKDGCLESREIFAYAS